MRRIAVVGASGRTGSWVVSTLVSEVGSSLGAAIVSPSSRVLGQKVEGSSISYSSDLGVLKTCDGVIDFSTPEVSTRVADMCVKYSKPLLVATTGHSPEQRDTLVASARKIPLCIAANTSVGATALDMAARYLKKLLGETFDVEVMEVHHRMKRDAPSGTAKAIVAGIAESSAQVVFGREGQRHEGEIGVVSLRGGDVPGDHTVFFLGNGERLEVTHRAQNREIFGRGAVVLMYRLCELPPGFYSVQELLLSGVE
jgi:4-hydroxy-tetrahydrodipicolinate reductase